MSNFVYSSDGYTFDRSKFTTIIKKSMLKKVENGVITGKQFITDTLKEDPSKYRTEDLDNDDDNYEIVEDEYNETYDDYGSVANNESVDVDFEDDDELSAEEFGEYESDGFDFDAWNQPVNDTDLDDTSNVSDEASDDSIEYDEEIKVTNDDVLEMLDMDEDLLDVVINHIKVKERDRLIKELGLKEKEPVTQEIISLDDMIKQSSVEQVALNVFRHVSLSKEIKDLMIGLDDTIVEIEPGEIVARAGTDICNFVNSDGNLLTTLGSLETIKYILINCDDEGTVAQIDLHKQILDNVNVIVAGEKNEMDASTFKPIVNETKLV